MIVKTTKETATSKSICDQQQRLGDSVDMKEILTSRGLCYE